MPARMPVRRAEQRVANTVALMADKPDKPDKPVSKEARTLTLAGGLAVLNAAVAEAERIGQPMCISVVDTLSYGVRSDDAELARDQTLFALLMGRRESSISGVCVQGRSVV